MRPIVLKLFCVSLLALSLPSAVVQAQTANPPLKASSGYRISENGEVVGEVREVTGLSISLRNRQGKAGSRSVPEPLVGTIRFHFEPGSAGADHFWTWFSEAAGSAEPAVRSFVLYAPEAQGNPGPQYYLVGCVPEAWSFGKTDRSGDDPARDGIGKLGPFETLSVSCQQIQRMNRASQPRETPIEEPPSQAKKP